MDFTFLKEEQIWGDGALDVIKHYGTKVAPTDLAVILGGYMTGGGERTSENDLTCAFWSASLYGAADVCCVLHDGDNHRETPNDRSISARPALPPSETSKISPSEARAIGEVRVAEYGEYPQTIADDVTSEKLERLHASRTLRPTGKNYTFDSVGLNDYITPFKATAFSEYEMDGKRYIRVPGRPAYSNSVLSNGEQVEDGKPYWVEVQPIEWLMDRSGTMVAKKCLFAGIQFDTEVDYDGYFFKTSMKHYLDTYFAKEIEPTGRVAERTVSRDMEFLNTYAELSPVERRDLFHRSNMLRLKNPVMQEVALTTMCRCYTAEKDKKTKLELLRALYRIRKGGETNKEKNEMADTFARVLDKAPELKCDDNLVRLSQRDTVFKQPTRAVKRQVESAGR